MNTKTVRLLLLQSSLFISCLGSPSFSLETDTFSSSIKDPDTIISRNRMFKMGFFTPGNNTRRYLGIFYAFSENTVIWVANRDTPLNDSSAVVTISGDGNLVLVDGRNRTVWSTNVANTSIRSNTSVQILDSGNLVLRDDAAGNVIWQSFSHPSDVILPTMNMTHNTITGKKLLLTTWRSPTDPAPGSFTSGIDGSNLPQSYIWHIDGRPHWRSGPWNGLIAIGVRSMYISYFDGFAVVKNDTASTFYYTLPRSSSTINNLKVNSSGSLAATMWNDRDRRWDTIWLAPENECDIYGTCGPFGSCNVEGSPICSCLTGFEPMNRDEWERGNWSGGCRRKKRLQCGGGSGSGGGGAADGFLRLQFMKVPDFAEQFFSRAVDECRTRCLGNCSCIAYAHDSNIGCMFWSETLIDVQKFDGVGVDLYIRLPASELDNNKDRKLHIIIPAVAGFVCISIFVFIAWCSMVKRKAKSGQQIKDKNISEAGQRFSLDSMAIVLKDRSENVNIEDLPLFTFDALANATNQFHENNLLGRGGFGPVYKGNLENGKEIAVKRLSAASGQGIEEFMNEVFVISKLQHRNLVRLLGCSIDKQEKMLVYEYMPNKSLDSCLFDPRNHTSQKVLDWKKRFNIIEGIGRGLLYLHKDSRLRIIHRDLKPSNILLDEEWNPKISDFGMARIFGGNEDHGNTAKVVGTYGYMAPEYAMEGRFSEKSDVYSFGVLILEILKGRKNIHFYNVEMSLGLLGCAWKLWSERNGFAFADERIASREWEAEIVRCIQIALLCVQEFAKDRPTIQTAVSMLSGEITGLPVPEKPVVAEGLTETDRVGYSINGLSLTLLDGR